MLSAYHPLQPLYQRGMVLFHEAPSLAYTEGPASLRYTGVIVIDGCPDACGSCEEQVFPKEKRKAGGTRREDQKDKS